MLNNKINILIFSKSDIVLKGLSQMITEIGFEPILLNRKESFFDYPNLLGYILVIITEKEYERHVNFIDKYYDSASKIKYLPVYISDNKESELSIEDSTLVIQHKIETELQSFSDKIHTQLSHELTPRELDVLKLIAHGYTNKEIANKLIISTHTVISHRKNLSEKTGIKTISGLTMYAVIKQLISIKDINTENLK